MTSRFEDRFNRVDGDIGTNYLIACGGVIISDEAVVPIDATQVASGISPIFPAGVTAQKTQVFLSSQAMDGPDYVVRGVWAHDEVTPTGVNAVPSFTLLARMSKDPLLYDLGTDEEPLCYDQGYGARVSFPLDSTMPVLKIIKYQPVKRIPDLARASSTEVDGAIVLASVTLDLDDLNLDPDVTVADPFDVTTDTVPYRGFVQDMRLRIRRSDREVMLDVYLNDRNLNQPKLSFTDRQDPLWGGAGLPGFEFLSATLTSQPSGTSPFGQSGLSLLRCQIFSAETFFDPRMPVRVTPQSYWTYQRVTNRVILLVEKNSDAKYSATSNTETKFDTYLDFVLETEKDIIRREGYWHWLRRSSRIYLTDGQDQYELPEDLALLEMIRPGNWSARPLGGADNWQFRQRLGGVDRSGGRPTFYTTNGIGPNHRQVITVFPVPGESDINTSGPNAEEDPFLIVEYFARQVRPLEPDLELPQVPQGDMDVLIYGSAAHALLLDTDDANASRLATVFAGKLGNLRRANNRKTSGQHTVFRSAADVLSPGLDSRIPLLRATSLEGLLIS